MFDPRTFETMPRIQWIGIDFKGSQAEARPSQRLTPHQCIYKGPPTSGIVIDTEGVSVLAHLGILASFGPIFVFMYLM